MRIVTIRTIECVSRNIRRYYVATENKDRDTLFALSIFEESAVPQEWQEYLKINADYYQQKR